MELSIIITNYKNPELLRVCIDSIRKNCKLTDYEIIVADSATEEDTELMMQENFPEIRFLASKENIGFSGTVNNGLKLAQGRYILILNGDIVVKEGSIEKLLAYIKNDPKAGIVGAETLLFQERFHRGRLRCGSYFGWGFAGLGAGGFNLLPNKGILLFHN